MQYAVAELRTAGSGYSSKEGFWAVVLCGYGRGSLFLFYVE